MPADGVAQIQYSFTLLYFSDVRARFGMPLQVPARYESGARKQRVDAGLRLRRIEDELSLAAFLLHRVVAVHCDLSERLAIRGDAIAEHDVIHGVHERRNAHGRQQSHNEQPLQETLDSGSGR